MKCFKRMAAVLLSLTMLTSMSFGVLADETDAAEPTEPATTTASGTEETSSETEGSTETTVTTETPAPTETVETEETVTPAPTIPPQYTNEGVYGYVVRLYETVLGRTAEEAGLNDWYGGLVEGRFAASEAALGFFESPEYLQKEKTNEEYVADLYRTFFDREGDAAGANAWLSLLDEGVSRRNVLKGFTDSDEFTRLCERFSVVKGTVDAYGPSAENYMIYRFVDRLYSETLGRQADDAGRLTWVNELTVNGGTGANVAYGFVFSQECQANTTDAAVYITTLYKTLLGRYPDEAGLEAWLNVLASGETREKVFEGFVNSDEFTAICAQYGIVRGDYHAGRYIDPNRPMIALTFDDGPCGRTHEILDCIENNGGAVTFFVQGCMAQYYPDDLRRMLDLGCEIGNHTYDHPYLSRLSAEGVASQVGRTNDIVRNATGSNPTVLRPPYGAHSATSDAVCGLPVIIWSVDTRDWATRNTQSTIDHVLSHARDGEIVLMHDIHPSTVDAALYLIPELQRRGYQLVTVSELAQYRGDGAQAGQVYYSFR
ncbi:MAG: DUF4214 domain-containing protein [Clostridiales bacterium]|nr:DUF4214 domain-containing protein [Clostridiales bacterium]